MSTCLPTFMTKKKTGDPRAIHVNKDLDTNIN